MEEVVRAKRGRGMGAGMAMENREGVERGAHSQVKK